MTPSEHYLFANRSYVAKHFALECKIDASGDTTINSDAFVFIHEATHFEDLQVEDSETPEFQTEKFNQALSRKEQTFLLRRGIDFHGPSSWLHWCRRFDSR